MPTYELQPELYQIQVGTQNAFATAATPTVKLMDVTKCDLKPLIKAEPRPYLRGSLAPNYVSIIKEIGGSATIESDLSYEDIHYWLEGLFGVATPGGTAAPYTRAGLAPLTAKVTPRILTVVKGASDGTFKLTGGVVQKVTIKGNSSGVWSAGIDLLGYDITTGTLASLSDRPVNPIMGGDTLLYIDAWGGTMGATSITGIQYDFELTIDTKREARRHMTLRPDTFKQPLWDVKFKLILEYTSVSHAYLNSILTSTPGAPLQHQVRIKASTGATSTLKTLQLDFAGTVEDAPTIFTDQDGVVTAEMNYFATYHTTFANYLKYDSNNGVSALA